MADDTSAPRSASKPAVTRAEVAARKRRIAAQSHAFPYTRQPNVSLIVLSFNHRARIAELLQRMRRTRAEEVIVCEDGSWDGSLEEWDRRLVQRNDLLLRTNDLHEIRAYDRAIRLAGAPIVCLLQDDDTLPVDGGWVAEALALFAADPQLAIVSGYYGTLGELYGTASARERHGIPYRSPVTRAPFMYVVEAFVGPFFVRKTFYEAVGGFDHAFSEPGECGILFEADLCYRAWLGGWRVGLNECFVKGDAGAGVTPGTWWNGAARQDAVRRNRRRLALTYDDPVQQEIIAAATALNTQLIAAPTEPAREAARAVLQARRAAADRRAGDTVLLRAGAVLYRGGAILLPCGNRRGTSRLIGALVRAGAELIGDDQIMVDAHGRVRLAAPAASVATQAAAVSLVVVSTYQEHAQWLPSELSGARAALLLLGELAMQGGTLRRGLQLASRLASGAITLAGPRPDADEVAPGILAYVDGILDRQASAGAGRGKH